jgi:hypothetical protein
MAMTQAPGPDPTSRTSILLMPKGLWRNTAYVKPECVNLIVSHAMECLRWHQLVEGAPILVLAFTDCARELRFRPAA